MSIRGLSLPHLHRRDLGVLVVAAALAGAISSALAQPTTAPLAVELGAPTPYRCAGGQALTVRYGRLSDGSLSFARLQLPGAPLLTLPQLVSASGARYSDERQWQWWSKGSAGWLQGRDAQGRWQTLVDGCNS